MQQWETALDDIQKLRDIIDANTFAPILQQLQQRVWLMHWSLFVFFEHENGRNAIIDLFFQDRWAYAIAYACLRCHTLSILVRCFFPGAQLCCLELKHMP